MVNLNNSSQAKKIQEIKRKEEEIFVERISQKFGIPYVDLSGTTIETDALRILSKEEAKDAQVAGFRLSGKDLYLAIKSPNLIKTKEIIKRLEKNIISVYILYQKNL